MKRFLSVIGYFILSIVLFLGGVILNSNLPGAAGTGMHDRLNNTNDQDTHPGEGLDEAPALGFDAAEDNEQFELVDVAESEPFLYYYSILDDVGKDYYTQIDEAVSSSAESVFLQGITFEEAEPILISVMNDHPEYFWLDNSYSYRTRTGSIEFMFNYTCAGGEKENRERIIEQQAAQIIAAAPPGGSDYEKVKYVFESLVDRTQYDESAPDNQNIYSVFGNWTTVCAGYAKSTKYLLDRMGVECIYVTGMAGERHGWNIVNCDGAYYCVDTTWGDPTYQEGIGVDVDTTSYEYLCCTSEMLSRTHTPDSMFPVPKCTDTSLEYYRMQGRYLATADSEEVLNIMKEDLDGGEERTDIQFSTPEVFTQVVAQIDFLLDQAMNYEMEVKGLAETGISYQTNENTCLLTVMWEN